jgi:hypothetical protein
VFPLFFKEADFVEWSGNMLAVSKANNNVWDLPEALITELETLHEQCQTLLSLFCISTIPKAGNGRDRNTPNGAVLFREVSEKPITHTKDLKASRLITRTPHSMRFSPGARGRLVYMAGQWQTG